MLKKTTLFTFKIVQTKNSHLNMKLMKLLFDEVQQAHNPADIPAFHYV